MRRPGAYPVVVVLDPTAGALDEAVRVAAREAAHRCVELHVLVPGHGPRGLPAALTRALAAARSTAPGRPVLSRPSPEPLDRAARTASAEAAVLVVPGPGRSADELVTTAFCPVLVVPRPGGGSGDTVLLAAGPATRPEVFEFAFAAAAARRAPVRVVRTWYDPLVELGRLLPVPLLRRDGVTGRLRAELDDQLESVVQAHPGVPVDVLVAEDDCAELLGVLGERAGLLVLGRPERGELLGGLAPSPVRTLQQSLPCPIAVVPPPGPRHRTLLPTRRVGLADLHR